MESEINTGVGESARGWSGGGTAIAASARPTRDRVAPYQRMADEDRGTGGESLADFLGFFSIGLGLAQVLAPKGMSKLCGVADADGNARLMRLMGMREIPHGIAILAKQQPETIANEGADEGIIRTRRSITIHTPVEEVYAFWRDFQNLPQFVSHPASITVTGENRSPWKAKAPPARSIRPSSSRTTCPSRRRRAATRSSTTSWTTVRRSS